MEGKKKPHTKTKTPAYQATNKERGYYNHLDYSE